ncbi:MAG: DUF6482 family protein [Oleiphilaceae bacterium]|nr:DUF6482 family protein [Oleiphilaceae bacterium]
MFEKLMSFGSKSENTGVIWSLEGDHYLAFQLSPQGDVVQQADHAFKCLSLAREWLENQGVETISLRQSNAYFEMVGQDTLH